MRLLACLLFLGVSAANAQQVDPAAWGSDHVGKPVPSYDDGNACLFCHRTTIGPGWQTNRHATTIRDAIEGPADRQGAELLLGRGKVIRLLKRTADYGTLAMRVNDEWNATEFGARCAGCHTSGVDSPSRTFQAVSLDCHTCHGIAEPEHTKDGALMVLSHKGSTPADIEVSICGSCHLRGGMSRSSGLPFANNFVPGDNLFKDFEVNLSDARIVNEGPGDAHVLQNVRDVVLSISKAIQCTSCHSVHGESSKQHTRLAEQPICFACHTRGEPMARVKDEVRHSAVCEY